MQYEFERGQAYFATPCMKEVAKRFVVCIGRTSDRGVAFVFADDLAVGKLTLAGKFVPLYPRVRFDEWVSGALYKAGDVVYRSASKQCYTAMRDVDDESATIVPGSDDDEIWQEFEISDIFEPYLTKLAAADLLTESQGKFQTQARADAEFEILCERYHEGNGESKIRRGRFI